MAATVRLVGTIMVMIYKDDMMPTPADPTRIDVDESPEIRFWVQELGRSAVQIKEAVRAVGPLVSDVRLHLRKRSLYKLR
jgi:Protein of unknown function (DUF3606)